MKNFDTIKKVHKLRKTGFNSLQISNRLGLTLISVNDMFMTSLPDPKNLKLIKSTRYDNKKQYKNVMKKAQAFS